MPEAGPGLTVSVSALPVHNTSHSVFLPARLYGSLHLAAIYVATVMQLPGLLNDVNEYILKLVGLWDPRVLSDMVPVLLVLLAATVHEALGRWLQAQPGAGEASGLARMLAASTTSTGAGPTAAAGPAGSGAVVAPTARVRRVLPDAATAGAAGGVGGGGGGVSWCADKEVGWVREVHPKALSSLISSLCIGAVSSGASLLSLLVSVCVGYLLMRCLWDIC